MATAHKKKIMIVTSTGFSADVVTNLEKQYGDKGIFVTVSDTKEEILERIQGVEALIGCPRPFFSKELLGAAGAGLEWIHVPGAGCEEFLIPELVESDIVLTNGKIIQGPEVSDHAVALLLCLTRNLCYVLRPSEKRPPRPIELRGKSAVIIGCGGVGMLIAEKLSAFGMKILGVSPDYVAMLSCFEKIYPVDRLHEALGSGDVVVMAAPKTEKTAQMMSTAEFAAMKDDAYFINISRGKTVDTDALVDCLQRGRLKGAGLDVTNPEPLPEEHPLRKMDNVVVTPHIAGPSDHNRDRSMDLIQVNIKRFLHDEPLVNIVNKKVGY